jgi:hypothetical protein
MEDGEGSNSFGQEGRAYERTVSSAAWAAAHCAPCARRRRPPAARPLPLTRRPLFSPRNAPHPPGLLLHL